MGQNEKWRGVRLPSAASFRAQEGSGLMWNSATKAERYT